MGQLRGALPIAFSSGIIQDFVFVFLNNKKGLIGLVGLNRKTKQ